MWTTFKGKRVSSILGILPERVGMFDDEVANYTFSPQQTMRLKKIMGFNTHRISKETTTVSDFAITGIKYIFEHNWITKEEIGAVIVATLCPDYFLPHISNIIQGECDLSHDVVCLDIAQGCCGYIVGLMESFMLLEHIKDKKIILVNGDVLMHRISSKDRNEYPIMGDAAAISIVENINNDVGNDREIHLGLMMDGRRRNCLKIPAGGFRTPSTPETAEMKDCGDGNIRALDHMFMDGAEVMNFVMREIPPLVDGLYKRAGEKIEDTDYFLFHQPNRFILEKLAQKMKVDKLKMPMDLVEKTGNPSGASIPLITALDFGERFVKNEYRCCLSGFGSGLAFGAILMNFGKFKHCEVIETRL